MRVIIILSLFLSPFFLEAQINRSAKELAQETIGEYITGKVFKNKPYKAVSFGELKPRQEKNKEITWSISHRFLIEETAFIDGSKKSVPHPYAFTFYLNTQMKVLRAEAYYVD